MEPTPPLLEAPHETLEAKPSIRRNASWGALITVFVIIAMVVVGALYEWGQRLAELRAENQMYATPTTYTTTATTTPTQ